MHVCTSCLDVFEHEHVIADGQQLVVEYLAVWFAWDASVGACALDGSHSLTIRAYICVTFVYAAEKGLVDGGIQVARSCR